MCAMAVLPNHGAHPTQAGIHLAPSQSPGARMTGIWQAEDDGVLNPATVRLVPGTIIPKAPGSAGLTPLAAPGNFDISQLVLNDLRARIRAAMLADRLGPPQDAKMTATEVLERS